MFASVVRTVVPLVVGVVVGQAARIGLDLDPGAVTSVVTVVVGWLYYQSARYLETHVSPRFGKFFLAFGLTGKAPVYVKSAAGVPPTVR